MVTGSSCPSSSSRSASQLRRAKLRPLRRRIDSVGAQELEDIYEEARNQLDVTVEKEFGAGFGVKLSAARLLGSRVEFTQFGDLIRGYDLGRTVSMSVSW